MLGAMQHMTSPGRGGHRLAMAAAETVYRCRREAAALFRMEDPSRVVFTMNATHALNIAIRSLVKPGDTVVISGWEHNAVTRPLHALGAKARIARGRLFDPESVLEAFRKALPGAKAAVCTHVSNVFGFVLPIEEIAALCREAGVPLIADAAQSAGVLDVDFRQLGAAFIAMVAKAGGRNMEMRRKPATRFSVSALSLPFQTWYTIAEVMANLRSSRVGMTTLDLGLVIMSSTLSI